jgi:hypothetical protein
MWEGNIKMRKLMPVLAVIAGATALAAPANAAVHIDFLQGTQVSSLPGFAIMNGFDTTDGITGSGFAIQSDTTGAGAKIPLADSIGTSFLSVMAGGTANIGLPWAISEFAFEWGSLDAYNTLTINLAGGSSIVLVPSFGDLSDSSGNGNQFVANTNGTVHVWSDAGEVFTGLTLQSTYNSLEFDNLSFKPGAVPEPATWGMMIAGLGAVGFSMRRKKAVAVRFA